MKRHILKDIDNIPNRIYGLVCTQPMVQLVWNFNEHLELGLERDDDIKAMRDTKPQFWQRFSFTDMDSETTYTALRNKGVDSLLAPELRNVDVFLIESNQYLTFQLSLDNISRIPYVNFCFEVSTDLLKPETKHIFNSQG